MDITALFKDFNIPFETEGKNCAPGWVNICCPSCADISFHLGYNLKQDYMHCWRCGHKKVSTVISKILNLTEERAWVLLKQYGEISTRPQPEPVVRIRTKAHRLPSGVSPLSTSHKHYLESRHYDPEMTEQLWNLVGTGPVSLLDGIDYKHRIIAPIIWGGEEVSFQSRDITGRHKLRYITCPKDRELVHHKHIIYGRQEDWTSTGICVEGITKVWRLGVNSFCTFGIEYTPTQVRVIAKAFKRVAVVFDPEPQAQKQAQKLVSNLRFRNVDAWNINIGMDPGDMKQEDADYFVKQLIK